MKNSIKPISFSALNPSDRFAIRKLLQLYQRVDKETQRFAKLSKIHCPPLCGYCCSTAHVETTPFEMLPLALSLWSSQKGDFWLEKLKMSGQKKTCVFFKSHRKDLKKGRCTVYKLRPLICRLFGFSFNKNKDGGYVYGGCKVIKQKYPKAVTQVIKMMQQKPNFLKMTDFSIRLFGLGSTTEQKLMPINQAAKIAFEKIGFILEKQKTQCKMY